MENDQQMMTRWEVCDGGSDGLIGMTSHTEVVPDKEYAEDVIVGFFQQIMPYTPDPSNPEDSCSGTNQYKGVNTIFYDRQLVFSNERGEETIGAFIFNRAGDSLNSDEPITYLDMSDQASEAIQVRYETPDGNLDAFNIIRCGEKFKYLE
jgi:hypothetical protein